MAAWSFELEMFHEILNWAKGNVTREEVNKLLLAKDNEGRSVFHVAAGSFVVEMFHEILNWAKGNLTSEEVNKLFLATNNEGRTAFREVACSDKI